MFAFASRYSSATWYKNKIVHTCYFPCIRPRLCGLVRYNEDMSAHAHHFLARHNHSDTRLERWFPAPSVLSSTSAGLDISDNSVKWVELIRGVTGREVGAHGVGRLPAGVVEEGVVQDVEGLAKALKELRESIGGTQSVHASLPEEAGYVFSMTVPDANDREQVRHMIEFELEGRVPLRANQSVYDYDIVGPTENGTEIGVTVFPASVVSGYVEACGKAGIELRSLEIESSSIARAVITPGSDDVSLVVDFGRARTGFAIIRASVPIFTSTVSVGGTKLTETVMKALGVDDAAANEFKDNVGLTPTDENNEVHEAVMITAATLSDEILRHYRYWDGRRNQKGDRVTPVARVLLAGGSATLKGLPEYIASRVQAPTSLVNVWHNVASFNDYIPPIEQKQSFGFATAIGLALRGI